MLYNVVKKPNNIFYPSCLLTHWLLRIDFHDRLETFCCYLVFLPSCALRSEYIKNLLFILLIHCALRRIHLIKENVIYLTCVFTV